MKWIKRIVIAAVLLIIIAVVIVYISLNGIIRSTVQSQATASLGVPTTLGGASLSLFGGKVGLSDLSVGSPKGFSSPNLFTLGGVNVGVQYGQLTKQPIHVNQIEIDNPALVVEQANGKLNLQELMNQMPSTPPSSSSGQPAEPMKLIIDQLDLNNAKVTIQPGFPGMTSPITATIPSITLKNIGNADGNGNGAALKDVIMQITTAMASKGTQAAGIPPEVQALLNGDLSGIQNQLGAAATKQLQGLTDQLNKNMPSNVNNLLKGSGINTTQQSSDITKGLGDLLGGKKKN